LKYRAEIDGLRAIAVVPIVLFHAGFEYFSGGFVGVDVFFVISGYLITTIILSEKEQGTFSLVNFYERRFRRILPALFMVMLVSLIFSLLWLIPFFLFSTTLIARKDAPRKLGEMNYAPENANSIEWNWQQEKSLHAREKTVIF